MKSKLAIVVVLYNKKIEDIRSIELLRQFCTGDVYVYDNSVSGVQEHDVPPWITYKHDPTNPGLAKAYNWALGNAVEKGADWLMVLDHDTTLNADFFSSVSEAIAKTDKDYIAVLMPVVFANSRIISPVSSSLFKYHKPITETGLIDGDVTGINSATTIRISFLKNLGGFNELFPLDYLDHWLFDQLRQKGLSIYVLNSTINQDLSIYNFFQNVSVARYESILQAKHEFYTKKGVLFVMRLKSSLIRDFIKFKYFYNKKEYSKLTLRYILKFNNRKYEG